jgi:hypothetical protein
MVLQDWDASAELVLTTEKSEAHRMVVWLCNTPDNQKVEGSQVASAWGYCQDHPGTYVHQQPARVLTTTVGSAAGMEANAVRLPLLDWQVGG